ncbi:MAG: ElyC/SanA/YdcF family protein [Erysipelotrichales bacterium]
MGYLLALTLFLSVLFIVFFKRNYASLMNGFLFMVASFFVLSSGLFLALQLENKIVNTIILIIAIPLMFIMFLSVFIAIFTLLLSAYKLFRNESKSLANSLTLLTGIGLIVYIAVTLMVPDRNLPPVVQFIWALVTSIITFYVFHISFFIMSTFLSYRVRPKHNKDYIIILGSGLIDGNVTPLLAKRIDRAITFYHKQASITKPPKLLFSGGQGPDESRAEALAMQEYAIKVGIPVEDTLVETKSRTTQENFKYSKEVIEDISSEYKAIFSTSNYHVFRSAGFAKAAGLPIYGLGARTVWYFYINALIREYIAHIWIHKKGHLIIVVSLISLATIFHIFSTLLAPYAG